MKRVSISLFMVFFFLAAGLLAGCDSGNALMEEEEELLPSNGTSMSAKLNGRAWRTDGEVQARSVTVTLGNETITAMVVAGVGLASGGFQYESIALEIVIDETGNWVEDEDSVKIYYEAGNGDAEVSFEAEGAAVGISVTEITDTVVKGTFSGVLDGENGVDKLTVTEGVFIANITKSQVQ